MADVLIENVVYPSFYLSAGRAGPYWTSPLVGYDLFIDTNQDLVYRKTIDGGATYGDPVAIVTGTVISFDCQVDWQTFGDAGTKVHIICLDAATNTALYAYLDTSNDSVGTDTIETCQGSGVFHGTINRIRFQTTICKAVGGNIGVAFRYQDNASAAFYSFYTSPDADTWTLKATPWETASDYLLLFPGAFADSQDLIGLFWDISANAITHKVFDNSANSWSETAIASAIESIAYLQMDAAVRLSDGYILGAFWNDYNTATADLQSFQVAADGTVTIRTDIITNTAEYFLVSCFINQNTGRWYVVYVGGTAAGDLVKVFYQYSDDSGVTWSGQQAMQADAEDDERWVSCGAVKAVWGGKFQPVWNDTDDYDLFTNTDNGISIPAAGGVTAYRDIATRFLLWIRGFKDIATRFLLWARNFKDIATKFLLHVQGYKDVYTRFQLVAQSYKDTSTRFRLIAQDFKDIATRFRLTVLSYKDIATRFQLIVQNYKDITTRFRLTSQSYKDIATRFILSIGTLAYKDVATRFRLTVQTYKDVATRFILQVQGYKDVMTRFSLWAQTYKDILTRFRLTVQAYQDIAARFRLTVQNYRDISTRFRLIRYYFIDVSTRFRLAMPGAYRDVGTRFFLYVPTWKELQLQQEVADLQGKTAELEAALEPKAHFVI